MANTYINFNRNDSTSANTNDNKTPTPSQYQANTKTNTKAKPKPKPKEAVMDMRRYLKQWITLDALEAMGGTYEGQILSIGKEELRNKFTAGDEEHPVIRFHDGWCLGLNQGMRWELVEALGFETDGWEGRWIRVYCRPISRGDPDDLRPVRYEKAVAVIDGPTDDHSGKRVIPSSSRTEHRA